MKRRLSPALTMFCIVALLTVSLGTASASGTAPMSDWSAWESYFTPIVPHTAQNPGNPAGLPIPTKKPSHEALMVWVNGIAALPEPAMMAHAEEVARGDDHSTIVGHGPAKGEPASSNAWATGGVLRDEARTGTYFETFDDFYGETFRRLPHLWGGYAYQGASSVTFDSEQVHKNEAPTDGTYSMKIAGSVPFEAGISRTIMVEPGAKVTVRAMYLLYDHGGEHDGNVLTYDWAALGIKCDDMDAEWVNGPWHGQWLPLEHTITAGAEGRIMIFLQVISPLAENVNAYFDDVQVWVNDEPYSG